MIISIISIGNELLKGTILNSNLADIGQNLLKIGLTPYFQATICDNKDDIVNFMNYSLTFSDILIITGGLGPTSDDITMKTIADYFNLELYQNQKVLENIKDWLRKKNLTPRNSNQSYFSDTEEYPRAKAEILSSDEKNTCAISKYNIKQTFVPLGSTIIQNLNGTAPGICIQHKNKVIYLLPGPPNEMLPMLENVIIPNISKSLHIKSYFRTIKTIGISESKLQEIVDKLNIANSKINIAYRATPEFCELTLCSANEQLLKATDQKLRNCFKNSALPTNYDDVVEPIIAFMKKNDFTMSTAESCTGGMIASKITDFAGVSSVFKGSCITYSNELKEKLLGVQQSTLLNHGAVSMECAIEMVNGLCKNLSVNAGIAVTGIAGPDGGSIDKPVGLVYIAVKLNDLIEVKQMNYTGDRKNIRIRTTSHALNMLRLLCIS